MKHTSQPNFEDFYAFLKRNAATVASWPAWKRNVTLDGHIIGDLGLNSGVIAPHGHVSSKT